MAYWFVIMMAIVLPTVNGLCNLTACANFSAVDDDGTFIPMNHNCSVRRVGR